MTLEEVHHAVIRIEEKLNHTVSFRDLTVAGGIIVAASWAAVGASIWVLSRSVGQIEGQVALLETEVEAVPQALASITEKQAVFEQLAGRVGTLEVGMATANLDEKVQNIRQEIESELTAIGIESINAGDLSLEQIIQIDSVASSADNEISKRMQLEAIIAQ
jgi:hypothetical protein